MPVARPQADRHSRKWVVVFLLTSMVLSASASVRAHEIPSDVQIQIYLKPQAQRLTALIRVPLAAMRDIEFASRGPGYLDLERIDAQLEDAITLWLLNDFLIYEGDQRLEAPNLLAARVALPSDRSFDDYETAEHDTLSERLAVETDLYWEQALLDVALEYEIRSEEGDFALQPTLSRLGLRTVTQIRFVAADGRTRGIGYVGDPGRVSLDPGFGEVFPRFIAEGFFHVLDGMDHLLFVVALVIPLLKMRSLVVVISAFTVAHSITLAASLFDLVPAGLWFPPLVEVLIAASILYMAFENLLRPSFDRRWLMAFGFGLVHGFGFSFALRETLEFAGDHLLTSLAAFNLGIELGQLLVLALVVPVLQAAHRLLGTEHRVPGIGIRPLTLVLSALVAHTAWHWFVERWSVFSQYSIGLPVFDLVFALALMRWLILALVAALVVWVLRGPFDRWTNRNQGVRGKPH